MQKNKSAGIELYLQSVFFTNSRFDNGFFILDARGDLLVDYPATEIRGKNFAYREYFQRTSKERKSTISFPYQSKRTGAKVITFTVPLVSYDGKFLGLLAGSVNLLQDNFAGSLRDFQVGKTGKVMVYDSKGKIIFHPNVDLISQDGEFSKSDPIFRDLPQKTKGMAERKAADGTEYVLAFQRLRTTDWILGVMQNKDEIMAPLISLKRQIALSLIVAFGLAIGIRIWGMGILVKPIKALSNSIR